jgi:hypothetical protein
MRIPSTPSPIPGTVGSGVDGSEVLSSGSCPAIASYSNAASSTVVAKGPIWSSELANATSP